MPPKAPNKPKLADLKAPDGFTTRLLVESPKNQIASTSSAAPVEGKFFGELSRGPSMSVNPDPSTEERRPIERLTGSYISEGGEYEDATSKGTHEGRMLFASRTVSTSSTAEGKDRMGKGQRTLLPLYPFDISLEDVGVTSVAFYPGGDQLAAGCLDGTVRVISMGSGEVMMCMLGHVEQVNCIHVSPEGDVIASAGQDGTIQLWNAVSGESMGPLKGHNGPVFSVAFNPHQGQRLASGGGDNVVIVWDVQGRREHHTMTGHTDYVLVVRYSPDGRYVASGGGDASIHLWEARGGASALALQGHDCQGACKCKGSVRVGKVVESCPLEGHSNAVSCLAFNRTGTVLASGSWDYTVRLWALSTDEAGRLCANVRGAVRPFEKSVLAGHSNWVKAVCFGPSGDEVATAGNDKSVRLWHVQSGELLRCVVGHDGQDGCTCKVEHFGLAGGVSAGCGAGGHTGLVVSMALSGDGRCFVTGDRDRGLRVWHSECLAEFFELYRNMDASVVEREVAHCRGMRTRHCDPWHYARSVFPAKKGKPGEVDEPRANVVQSFAGVAVAYNVKELMKEHRVLKMAVIVDAEAEVVVIVRVSGAEAMVQSLCVAKFLVKWVHCAAALGVLAEGADEVSVRFFGAREVPMHIECLQNMVSLDLSDNDLTRVPVRDLCQVRMLRSLVTQGNPRLFSPPPEVGSRGGEANMAYLREAELSGQFNQDVQLIWVGPADVGKTSTIASLLSETDVVPFPKSTEDYATVGIEETDWEMPGMNVHLKDMSGQSVYSATNQLFLVRRALYVIVWRFGVESRSSFGVNADIRRDIEHWMDFLYTKVPGVPVMLVATHKDTVGLLEASKMCKWAREVANKKLARLAEIGRGDKASPPLVLLNQGESIQVSNLDGDGIKELRATLIKIIKNLPWFEEALPGSFVRLRDKIRKIADSGQRFMTVDEVFDMEDDCGIIYENHEVAIELFHDLGEVKHFSAPVRNIRQPLTLLQDTVYISPSWIMDSFKGMIRHDRDPMLRFFNTIPDEDTRGKLWAAQRLGVLGMVHDKLLPFLWPVQEASRIYWRNLRAMHATEGRLWHKDVAICKQDHDRIVALLEQSNLLHRVNAWESKIPILLSPSVRSIDICSYANEDTPYVRQFLFNLMPVGFFEMLLVRCLRSYAYLDHTHDMACIYGRGYAVRLFNSRVNPLLEPKTSKSVGTLKSPVRKFNFGSGDSLGGEVSKEYSSGNQVTLLFVQTTSLLQMENLEETIQDLLALFPGMPLPKIESSCVEPKKKLHHLKILASSDGKQIDHALSGELKKAILKADEAKKHAIPLDIDDTYDPLWNEAHDTRGVIVCLSGHLQDYEEMVETPTSTQEFVIFLKEKIAAIMFQIAEVKKQLDKITPNLLAEAKSAISEIEGEIAEYAKMKAKAKGKKDEPDPEAERLERELVEAQAHFTNLTDLKKGENGMLSKIDDLMLRIREAEVRQHFCEQFVSHVKKGHFIIPVLLPGYVMSLAGFRGRAQKWWPKELPELEGKQFVDARFILFDGGKGINTEELDDAANVVLWRANKVLDLWRGSNYPGPESIPDKVPCQHCLRELSSLEHREVFDRRQLQEIESAWIAKANEESFRSSEDPRFRDEDPDQKRGGAGQPTILCKQQHRSAVYELLVDGMHNNVVPCPQCAADCRHPTFFFRKNKCLEYYGKSASRNPDDLLECLHCTRVNRPNIHRILDIWSPPIYVSYHRGYMKGEGKFYAQDLISPLLQEVEGDLSMDLWAGLETRSTSKNIDLIKECISKSMVVIIFLSDSYVNYGPCQREFLAAVRAGRYIIPVLLPMHKPPDGGVDCGWSGIQKATHADWWQHADKACRRNRDPDTGGPFNFSALSQFTPVDMRNQKQFDSNSLAIKEIKARVVSRFHRGEMVEHKTLMKYRDWRKSVLFQDVAFKEENYEEAMLALFKFLDTDKSNGISKKELVQAFYNRGVQLDWDEAEAMFEVADTNGDNSISLQEFRALIKKM